MYKYYTKLAMIFVALLLTANTIGNKPLAFGPIIIPAGLTIFPLTYLLAVVITEVYGYQNSRKVIWTALFCNLIMAVSCYIAIQLPALDTWQHSSAYAEILGRTFRLMILSVVTYGIGEFVNAYIVAKLKEKLSGKFLFFRGLCGSWIGEGVETLLFVPLAFNDLGTDNLAKMMITYYLFKLSYSFLCMPIVVALVKWLEERESAVAGDARLISIQ